MKSKLMMAMVLGAATASFAAPITQLVDWELSNGAISGANVGTGAEWTGVKKVGNFIEADGNALGFRGARDDTAIDAFNNGDEFVVKTTVRLTPAGVKNAKAINFYLTNNTTTVADETDTAFAEPVLTSPFLGFQIEAKGTKGIAITSGLNSADYVYIGFADLGIADGNTTEFAFDTKFSAKKGDDGKYDLALTITSGEHSATGTFKDNEFDVGTDPLYFEMFTNNNPDKMSSVSLDKLTAQIPEPATFGLVGLAAAGLAAYRRRKQF